MDNKTEHYKARGIPAHAIPPAKKAGKGAANRIQNAIAEYCKYERSMDCFRVNSQGQYDAKLGKFRKSGSTDGISDLIVIYKGVSMYVEVKAGRDKIRKSQADFCDRVQAADGVYFVVKSFDMFIEHFNRYKPAIDLFAGKLKEVSNV